MDTGDARWLKSLIAKLPEQQNSANRLLPRAVNMNDSPAWTDPEEAALGRPTQTARGLVEASVSPNTRRAYAGALRRLDAWLDGRELNDMSLAAYLAELHGRRPRRLGRGDGGRRGVLPREARMHTPEVYVTHPPVNDGKGRPQREFQRPPIVIVR